MALVTYPDNLPFSALPHIPPVADLMPSTRRWRKVRPCGTAAAYRRHWRRGEPVDGKCAQWHRDDERARYNRRKGR